LVKVYVGSDVQELQVAFTNMQRPIEKVKEEVMNSNILKRGMNTDPFHLVTRMNVEVTDFPSIGDQPFLIFHIPNKIVPLSGNEWTDFQLEELKIDFEDVDLQTFFANAGPINLEISSCGQELVEKLKDLGSCPLIDMYVPIENPDGDGATSEGIRSNPLLQNPICKALFAARKYQAHESFVDDFVKHLLDKMGFNEGSLYAAPQLRISLAYGEAKKVATADVTIIDLLSFARIGVVEDKNFHQMHAQHDSTPQLIAEGIAITQYNEKTAGLKRDAESESEIVYGIRVTGTLFHFYAIAVSQQIHTAMMRQVVPASRTTMSRYKSDVGLDFMSSKDREEIILMLSALQQVATNTGKTSRRRSSMSR
jgi:hypothetical protein